jgi:hypothetical protein
MFSSYRIFNATPKIFVGDLIKRHCSGRGVVLAFEAKRWRETVMAEEWGCSEGRALSKTEMDMAVYQAAGDAMRSLGTGPSKDPGRRQRP